MSDSPIVTVFQPAPVRVTVQDNVVRITGVQPNYPKLIKAGFQGPPGVPGSSLYRSNIEPAGVKDEVNTTFTLPEIPLAPTLELYINGLLEDPFNYTIIGNQIVLSTAPRSWWRLSASYFV